MLHEVENAKRARILRSLEVLEGDGNTSQIREVSGIDTHQINYHMQVLLGAKSEQHSDKPLVERDGQEQLDDVPIPANRYRLTGAGRDALEEIDVELTSEIEQLHGKVDQIQNDVEELRDNFNELLARI